MTEKSFNLLDRSWIRVIDFHNETKTVSLEELFKNAADYRQLAGEMHAQDLAILRFLLAILTTVYSRFDADGDSYKELEVDPHTLIAKIKNEDSFDGDKFNQKLLKTWQQLYQNEQFSSILFKYLETYRDRFDFLDQQHPFYQVTREEYNQLVPGNKSVEKGKGTVAVKQMDRAISESDNSPDIFTPKSDLYKNQVKLDELIRWLITYQNFAGTTDKTKVKSKNKFSTSKGWLYGLNPIFAKGRNLFQTLMLNLVLIPFDSDDSGYHFQKPVWEFDSILDYVNKQMKGLCPTNIAELYTLWSRIIHIEWKDNVPVIFSAGLPKIDNSNCFEKEPMTTWKYLKDKNTFKPAVRSLDSLSKAMWRNFGQYIKTKNTENMKEPGLIQWLNSLQRDRHLSRKQMLNLVTTNLISDGNATSQSPAAEFYDEMNIQVAVLFDHNPDLQKRWTVRIENMVDLTGNKVGKQIWFLARNVGNLRALGNVSSFASEFSASFFESLNVPFYAWLASLRFDQERNSKVREWEKTLKRIAFAHARSLLINTAKSDIIGKKLKKTDQFPKNIFNYYQEFMVNVNKVLKPV